MENEIWKPIKGFETLYEISNLGRVKSLPKPFYHIKSKSTAYKKERILRISTSVDGYRKITLRKNHRSCTYSIHRLIAVGFIPNPDNLRQVNHKDGNKLNNAIQNLEWCTQLENMQHAYKTGLINNRGENSRGSKLNNQKVLEIRAKYIPRKYTFHALASEYAVEWGTIWRIISRRSWIHI